MPGPLLPAPGWKFAIERYLESLQGLGRRGMRERRGRLRRFTRQVAEQAPEPSRLTRTVLESWIAAQYAAFEKARAACQYVSTTRCFLRWLHGQRLLGRDLASFVRKRRPRPAAAGWRPALQRYLDFWREHRGALHMRSLDSWLRRFTREIATAARTPSALTLDVIDAWVAKVSASGVQGDTVRHYVSAIRGFLRWLHGERLLDRDLAAFVESPIVWRESAIPVHFTWPEVRKMLAALRTDTAAGLHDRALLLLFAACGMRVSEAMRLQLEDLDFERQTVRLRQRKTGDWLVQPLPAPTLEALRDYIENGRPASKHREVFLTQYGLPFKYETNLSTRIRRLARRAGLDGRGAQALRRAVGTRLVEGGASLGQVALILGHRGLQSSRNYVRVSMRLLAEVADNYGELL